MQSHRTAKYVAFHNCNSSKSFQQCMQKPKEHSKAFESIITTRKSHNTVCLVYYHSLLKVQTDPQVLLSEVLLNSWSASSQVFGACNADVLSGLVIKTVSCCSVCCTEHQPLCIVWLHELAVRGAETASVVFLVKTSGHFLRSNVVYLCSFLAVVNLSDLLLLQNTHTQPLSQSCRYSVLFNWHRPTCMQNKLRWVKIIARSLTVNYRPRPRCILQLQSGTSWFCAEVTDML